MKNLILFTVIALSSVGCGTTKPLLELGEKERSVIAKLQARVADNGPKLQKAARNLGELGAEYEALNFELEDQLAKARQLESMQSFLTTVPEEFRQTQRAVVLYHLYETEQAEQSVLQSRMNQRRQSTVDINRAYTQFATLLNDALKNMEVILRYANQPKSARIQSSTDNFLTEVRSFRTTLEATESTRLKSLAADVQKIEERALKARQKSADAIQKLISLKGEK